MTDTIPWKKKGVGINWILVRDDEVKASLESEGPLSSRLRASYDGIGFELVHESRPSRYILKMTNSDAVIGSMEIPFIMTSVWMNHGKEYQIEIEGNNCYFKDRTRNLAVTKYRRGAFSIEANYSILDVEEGDPNPYLIAVLSLFVAIFDSFGLGEI